MRGVKHWEILLTYILWLHKVWLVSVLHDLVCRSLHDFVSDQRTSLLFLSSSLNDLLLVRTCHLVCDLWTIDLTDLLCWVQIAPRIALMRRLTHLNYTRCVLIQRLTLHSMPSDSCFITELIKSTSYFLASSRHRDSFIDELRLRADHKQLSLAWAVLLQNIALIACHHVSCF